MRVYAALAMTDLDVPVYYLLRYRTGFLFNVGLGDVTRFGLGPIEELFEMGAFGLAEGL